MNTRTEHAALTRLLCLGALTAGSALYGDVGVTVVTSNPTPVAGGAAFSYTITVTNDAGAVPLTVIDAMPQSILFLNVTVVPNPVNPASPTFLSCSGPPVGTNGPVICKTESFGQGTATITIVAQVAPDTAPVVRTNTVTALGDGGAVPNVLPNTASVQQNIVNDATLTITKTAPAQVTASDYIAYNLSVGNGGSSSAINVTVRDILPAGLTFQSVLGSGAFHGGCAFRPATNEVVCSARSVPTGLSEITIVARTRNLPQTITNTATLVAAVGQVTIGQSSASTVISAVFWSF